MNRPTARNWQTGPRFGHADDLADDLLGLIAEETRNLAQLAGTQIEKEKGELDRAKDKSIYQDDSRPNA